LAEFANRAISDDFLSKGRLTEVRVRVGGRLSSTNAERGRSTVRRGAYVGEPYGGAAFAKRTTVAGRSSRD